MAVTRQVRNGIRARPATITALLSVVGYALVIGTFAGVIDVYPDLSNATVNLLTHLIAVINTLALASLLAGIYFIKNRDYQNHARAMLSAFTLIMLFLVVYLFRVGGGFEKAIVAPDLVRNVYLSMLAVHILLSVVSVPVVLYVVLLGLTHSPTELAETLKARVGRIAASAWILSLFLGVVTYLLLNHVYGSEPREEALLLCALAVPEPVRWRVRERVAACWLR
jgi:putative membrane protein